MKQLIAGLLLGLLGIGTAMADTVPSVNLSSEVSLLTEGDSFSVLVSASNMPEVAAASLGLNFDPAVIAFTGINTVAGSPIADALFTDGDPNDGSIDWLFGLAPLVGELPVGNFDVFELTFLAVGAGISPISLVDDGLIYAWSLEDASPLQGVEYGNFSVQVSAVPVPAAVWLLLSGLVSVAGLRRTAA